MRRLLRDRMLKRDCERRDGRCIEGAGSNVSFLATPVHDRSKGEGGVEDEGADAKGATDLVAADSHRMSADLREIHRDLADCLHCIRVERDSGFAAEFGDSPHRLDGSDLVVRPHDSA